MPAKAGIFRHAREAAGKWRAAEPGSAYCRRYGIKTLVLAGRHDDILAAIAHEKALKAWKHERKIVLVKKINPRRDDPFKQIA